MDLIHAKHYIAINHGNTVIVPLKDMNLLFLRNAEFNIRDDEEREIFAHYPNVELCAHDNYMELKPFVVNKEKLDKHKVTNYERYKER